MIWIYLKNYPCHLNINFKYFNCIPFLNVLGFLQRYLLDGYINCLVLFSSDFIIRFIMALEFQVHSITVPHLNTLQSDHHHASQYHPSPRSWLSPSIFPICPPTSFPSGYQICFLYLSFFMELPMVLNWCTIISHYLYLWASSPWFLCH